MGTLKEVLKHQIKLFKKKERKKVRECSIIKRSLDKMCFYYKIFNLKVPKK